MPRRLRIASGGYAYHVLNRAVGRGVIFKDDADYQAMLRVIERTWELFPIRILSFCLMPNHWHLVLWPKKDGQLSEFMRLLTVTHTQRWHAHHQTAGTGPLYQGRFKSFPIQEDEHLLSVCRYVERNALRAKMVESAGLWPYGSIAARGLKKPPPWLLPQDRWPVDVPAGWARRLDRPQSPAEEAAMRVSIQRGRPFGDDAWTRRIAPKLGLESTLRPRGRPHFGRITPFSTRPSCSFTFSAMVS